MQASTFKNKGCFKLKVCGWGMVLQWAVINETEVSGHMTYKRLSLFGFESENRSHAGVHAPGWEEPCTAAQLPTGLPQVSIQES